jgi:hypothetical protein
LCLGTQAFRFLLVHYGKLPIGLAWILPLDDSGKVSFRNPTVRMPVGRTQAFRFKQCPFWLNFGYVVPKIKYTPKLVEHIRYNGYGMIMTYIS